MIKFRIYWLYSTYWIFTQNQKEELIMSKVIFWVQSHLISRTPNSSFSIPESPPCVLAQGPLLTS